MDIARTSQTSPAASVPQGGTEDLFRELQPAQSLISNKYDILHLLETCRGRNGALGNAGGNPSVHSSSLSLLRLAGYNTAAHMEGSTRDSTV